MTDYEKTYFQIKQNWDSIAKPLDGLGRMEEIVAKIGAIQNTVRPDISRAAVVILCSDNGIVEEGVSQSDQSVTRICAENIAAMKSPVGTMAKSVGADVITVDLGINTCEFIPGVLNMKIRKGTRNFLHEPAMTEEETGNAIEAGKKIVAMCKEKGCNIICIGEMGIGNTTTSAAVAAALLKLPASEVTGRGAGLDDEGLKRKISVINKAVDLYDLTHKSTMQVLQTAGGFDIAGMAGVYLAAKEAGIPVVLDGAISLISALVAKSLDSKISDYLIPSHKGREPLCMKVCQELSLEPVLDASMALGEGTGAVFMLPVIKTALSVYNNCTEFSKTGIEQYKRYN